MKLRNGNTLMANETFDATVKNIRGRFDQYQSATEFALYLWFTSGDKRKAERLFKAFVGVRGRVIGDGKLLVAYVNRYCYGFKVEADGSITIEKKKNNKPKPRGFKAYNDSGDLSYKVGGHDLGFADTIQQYQKAAEAEREAKAAEREAKAAEAEAAAEAAKAAKAEAKAADADAEAEAAEATEAEEIDYSRMTNVAWALNELASRVIASESRDVEAMAEAAKAADTIAGILRKRIAEAEAEATEAEADAAAEAAEATEADAAAEA